MKLFKFILAVCGICYLSTACQPNKKQTDYEQELTAIKAKIHQLETDLSTESLDKDKPANSENVRKPDTKKIVTLAYQYLLKASLTGDYEDYFTAEQEINQALEKIGRFPDLYVFRASLNFKLHRLEKAKADLTELADNAEISAMKADIALQEGHYDKALSLYQKLLKEYPSWDNYSRLAYFKLHTGHIEEADQLYQQAADDLTAKQMRSYAWVELQRGLLDLQYQRYDEALKHYQQANRAYSGYWLIEEHIAEVLDLLGRTDEAVKMYEMIINKTNNSEFIGALADIINRRQAKTAEALYKKTQQQYQRHYELYPEAVGGHLIEYLLTRDSIDSNLLSYAKSNHQLRPNAEAKFLLAQTYSKLNRPEAMKALLREIAETPWRTPEIKQALAKQNLIQQ